MNTTIDTRSHWNPWRIIAWGTAAMLLLLPLIAMQFTQEVNWTASDFAFMAGMLGSVGVALELAFRKSASWSWRGAVIVLLAASFLSIWITAAVGIIGSEQDDVIMLYLGVVAIAIVGSVVARFRASGMVWVMSAAALAELLVPFAAAIFFPESRDALWSPEVPISTAVLTAMWLFAASLFRKAA